MERKQLWSYLRNVYVLEAEIYKNEAVIKQPKEKADTLCRKANIVKDTVTPVPYQFIVPQPETNPFRYGVFNITSENLSDGGCIIGLLLLPITVTMDLFNSIIDSIKDSAVEARNRSRQADADKENEKRKLTAMQEAKKLQEQADERYRDAITEETKRMKKEESLRMYINSLIDAANNRVEKLRTDVEKLYTQDILKPKYRNLVAVSKLFEYIDSAMTDTLTGANGAYVMYEQDLRADRICTSVSVLEKAVTDHLESIERNQYNIYTEIGRTNALLTSIRENLYTMQDSLYSTQSLLSEISRRQISANKYLSSFGRELNAIGENVNRTALNTSSQNLDEALKKHERSMQE